MGKPQVPIEVDDVTGVWSVDAVPMILVPRHFFVNNHNAIEQALGAERSAALAWDAGYKSAYVWCGKESVTHGLSGIDVFHHYMKRLSQRGWGQFHVHAVDIATGAARIHVGNSVFVLQAEANAGHRLCHAFRGWFCGSLEYVGHALGREWKLDARETHCAAEGGESVCAFEVGPRA